MVVVGGLYPGGEATRLGVIAPLTTGVIIISKREAFNVQVKSLNITLLN